MHPLLPIFLLAPALLAAEMPAVAADTAERRRIPAISMLPPGSVLEGVMLPRYDETRHLTSVLHAGVLTLVNENEIRGDDVRIRFFNPDRSTRATINLAHATLDQESATLAATQDVEILSDRLTATGTGIRYSLDTNDGFLLGPATTRILPPPPETAMIPRPRPAALLAALTLPLAAEPPPRLTADDYAALHADSASRAETIAEAQAETADALAKTTAASAAAQDKTLSFLQKNGLTRIANELQKTAAPVEPAEPDAEPTEPTEPNAEAPAEPGPLDLKAEEEDTIIRCEDGMYFDAEEGLLVYLKNIVVTDPRFTITASGDLKVFFAKKAADPAEAADPADPAAPATDPEPSDRNKDDLGFNTASFGEVERIVATGVVVIEQKAVGDKPAIKASGAILSYNIKSEEIILSGGYPWVVQPPNAFRATQPNQTLRIFTNGTFTTDGGTWDTKLRLEKDR